MTTTQRRPAVASAPPKEPAHAPLDLTRDQLRAGVYATWYPAILAHDEAGQRRIDRTTDQLIDAARA